MTNKSKAYLGITGVKRADIILKELGDKYHYMNIDGEMCIYRKLDNNYDVEISGLITRAYKMSMTLYVWKRAEQVKIIQTVSDVETIEELQKHLKDLEKRVAKGDLQASSS